MDSKISDIFFLAKWRTRAAKIMIINMGRETPLPREKLKSLILHLQDKKLKVVGLDIILTEEKDRELIDIIEGMDNIVIPGTPGLKGPRKGLKIGFSEIPVDPDGVCRRAKLYLPAKRLPSFGLLLASLYFDLSRDDIHPKNRMIMVGQKLIVPLERDGTMRVNFCENELFALRDYDEISKLSWEQFENGIVLIGSTEQEGSSIATPVSQSLPGIYLQAQIINTIIEKSFLRRMEPPLLLLIAGCFCFITFFSAFHCKSWATGIIFPIIMGAGYFFLAFLLFAKYNIITSIMIPEASIILSLSAGFGYKISQKIAEMKGDTNSGDSVGEKSKAVNPGQSGGIRGGVGDIRTGLILGKYRIIKKLGAGGMGEVYQVEHLNLSVLRAIKLVRPELLVNPMIREKFHREAELAARLSSPCIIDIHDYGELNGIPYIEMEYFESRSLREEIRSNAPLESERILELLEKITLGLQCAHNALPEPMIHMDLKPENILISAKDPGMVKIIDFGLAKALKGDLDKSQAASELLGTPYYMAPEQIKLESIGAGTDIYALGVILFEMITGQRPFHEGGYFGVMNAHLESPVPHVSNLNPDYPGKVDSVIEKAMAKDMNSRYGNVKELYEELRAAFEGRRLEK